MAADERANVPQRALADDEERHAPVQWARRPSVQLAVGAVFTVGGISTVAAHVAELLSREAFFGYGLLAIGLGALLHGALPLIERDDERLIEGPLRLLWMGAKGLVFSSVILISYGRYSRKPFAFEAEARTNAVLHTLFLAEGEYYGAHRRYTADLSQLRGVPNGGGRWDVRLKVTHADSLGWDGEARGVTKTCAMTVRRDAIGNATGLSRCYDGNAVIVK